MKTEFISVSILADKQEGDTATLSEISPMGFVWSMKSGDELSFVTAQVPANATGKVSFHLHWLAKKNCKILGSLALAAVVYTHSKPHKELQVLQSIVNQKCNAMQLEIADFGEIKAPPGSVISLGLFLKTNNANTKIIILGLDMVVEVEKGKKRKSVARK